MKQKCIAQNRNEEFYICLPYNYLQFPTTTQLGRMCPVPGHIRRERAGTFASSYSLYGDAAIRERHISFMMVTSYYIVYYDQSCMHIHARTHAHPRVRELAHACAPTHTRPHTHTQTHAQPHACTHARQHAHAHAVAHVGPHTHTHMHTLTRTHSRTHMRPHTRSHVRTHTHLCTHVRTRVLTNCARTKK